MSPKYTEAENVKLMKKAEELVSVEEVRENPREICNEINCLSDQELKAFIVKILT